MYPGLTGFDSKLDGYVSIPSIADTLVNLICNNFNWRK